MALCRFFDICCLNSERKHPIQVVSEPQNRFTVGDQMLGSNRMIGFVITKDSKRARQFYEQALGFKYLHEDQFALVMETDQNMIRISPVKDHVPAQHTILGWEVKEIEQLVTHLGKQGVVFERY